MKCAGCGSQATKKKNVSTTYRADDYESLAALVEDDLDISCDWIRERKDIALVVVAETEPGGHLVVSALDLNYRIIGVIVYSPEKDNLN